MSSRAKILLCARELFYHVGYHATSVDDIIRQCGVAKSNFYYHFKTKDELAFAVMDQLVAEYETLGKRTLWNMALSPTERLEGFLGELCSAQTGHQRMAGCPFGNFAAALPDHQDERTDRFRQRLNAFFQQMQGNLHACLRDGMASGEFRNDLPQEALATLLMATIQGLLLLTKTQKDSRILEQGTFLLQQLLKVT